jgi:hypothetical protein
VVNAAQAQMLPCRAEKGAALTAQADRTAWVTRCLPAIRTVGHEFGECNEATAKNYDDLVNQTAAVFAACAQPYLSAVKR